ncbi:MAG: hypothetical protein ACPGLV_00865 [Bacteroidia bacterium]
MIKSAIHKFISVALVPLVLAASITWVAEKHECLTDCHNQQVAQLEKSCCTQQASTVNHKSDLRASCCETDQLCIDKGCCVNENLVVDKTIDEVENIAIERDKNGDVKRFIPPNKDGNSSIRNTNLNYDHKIQIIKTNKEAFDFIKEEVLDAKRLMDLGAEKSSELVNAIEQVMSHPIDSFTSTSNKISIQLKELIKLKILSELQEHDLSTCINNIWIQKNTGDNVHFIISLKKNEFAVRDALYDVMADYMGKEISERHQVLFTFISLDQEDKLFFENIAKVYGESTSESGSAQS